MAENLKYQFESQGIQFDTTRLNAPEYRTGYRLQAEKNIRTRLVLARIAESEQLQLADEDEQEIYAEISKAYAVDLEKVKREYADSALVEQAKERKLEDKVLKIIEAEAVYLDKPEEPEVAVEPENADKAEDSASSGAEQEK
jgi:trigger factor